MMIKISNIINKICRLAIVVRSYFPQRLPVGMTTFKEYASDVYELTGPIADFESLQFALASQIMHADAHRCNPPMQYFVRRLIKVAANQVAGQTFQDIKLAQQERAKQAAEELAKHQQAEDIAITLGNGDGRQQ